MKTNRHTKEPTSLEDNELTANSTEPTVHKTTLDNGLRVVTSEIPHTRSVCISFFIGAGSRHEVDEQAGIAHFVEHMLFKGTESRPTPMDISGCIEGMGGMMNAHTEHEMTIFWCKAAYNCFDEVLDLMIDVMRNSAFDAGEVEKERKVVFEELSMNHDHPDYALETLVDEMLWPGHPLGRDIAGSRDTVAGITGDMLAAFVGLSYSPSNIVLSVAGNVRHDSVVRQADALTSGWKPREPLSSPEFDHVQSEPCFRNEYRRTEQTNISLAFPGLPSDHPDRYALDLLSVVLGEGMSSRLFIEIRENLGLAYDVHSGVSHFQDTGSFVVTAGVEPARTYEALGTIVDQLAAIKNGVPEPELVKAKHLAAGRLMLQMEDTRAVSGWNGAQELIYGRIHDADEIVALINAITSEDVCRVAKYILRTDRLNIALVGPNRGRKRIERLLEQGL